MLAAAAARTIPAASAAAARRAIETATITVNIDGAVEPALALINDVLAAQPAGTAAARDLELLRASILLLATGGGDPQLIQAGFGEAFAAGRFRTALDRARVLHYLLLLGVGSDATLAFLLEVTASFVAAGVASLALDFRADAVQAALLAGHLDRAVALADELLERPAPLRVRQTATIHRARALTFLGQFDAAEADLNSIEASVSPDWFGRGELLNARSELAFWSGQAVVALRYADAALAVPAPLAITHLTPLVHRSMVSAELGEHPGVRPEAPLPPSLAGASPEMQGHALSEQGQLEAAADAFERAAAGWAGFHEPRRMICRWLTAETLRRAGQTGAAVDGLRSTLDDATAARFEALGARIRRSLRQAGVRTTGRASSRPSPMADVLTTRERELVGLVERGLTNIEIARRLGLGRPTVTRILASAMTKLGVESRAQLAALVDA
jgi:DNA-binding CsgD family transcriptional regulator